MARRAVPDSGSGVFFATTANVSESLVIADYILKGIAIVGAVVFSRMLRRVRTDGVKSRPDLLAFPEVITSALLLSFFVMLAALLHWFPETAAKANQAAQPEAPTPQTILGGALSITLPALVFVGIIVMRGGSLSGVLGLGRCGFWKSVGLGIFWGVLALALTLLVKAVTIEISGSNEPPQRLVQFFTQAVAENNVPILAAVAVSAVILAPLGEELLFRGAFYLTLSRSFSRVPSAFFCAVVFAFVHDTWTDLPGLAVLALLLTLAYERTGSLLTPFFMHLTFNAVSLVAMFWQLPSQP